MINYRTNNDAGNLLILAVPVSVVGYLAYRWFGFEFVLSNGTTLVCLALFIVVLRTKVWWPAAFLLAQVAFQGMLTRELGLLANLLTVAAVAAFLSRQSARGLWRVLLGTTTQKLAALFVLGISISMLWADQNQETWLLMAQRIMVLFIVAAVAAAFRTQTGVARLAWITVASVGTMYFLSEIDFYFGDTPLPFTTGTGLFDLTGEEIEAAGTTARLGGIGYNTNRFAFIGILPISMAIGLLTMRRGLPWFLLVSMAALVLGLGVVLSGSRAGALGAVLSIVVTLLIIGPKGYGSRFALTAVGFAAVAFLMFQVLPGSLTSYVRIFNPNTESSSYFSATGAEIDQQRLDLWQFGYTLFREQPISGVGFGNYKRETVLRGRMAKEWDPHSAFVEVIAETGLLGAIPFAILLVYVVRVLTRRGTLLSSDPGPWKAVFLAAFIGMAVYSIFGGAHFARFFWIPIAFAVSIESNEGAVSTRAPISSAGSNLTEGTDTLTGRG